MWQVDARNNCNATRPKRAGNNRYCPLQQIPIQCFTSSLVYLHGDTVWVRFMSLYHKLLALLVLLQLFSNNVQSQDLGWDGQTVIPYSNGVERSDDWLRYELAQPSWQASVEALAISRSREKGEVLALSGAESVLSVDDLNLQIGTGTRFAISGDRLGWPLEIAYSNLNDWTFETTRTGDLIVKGPGFVQGFGNGDYRFRYASQFQSAEINLYFFGQRFFVGPRWMELDETIESHLQQTTIYSLRGENTLIGGQVGTVWELTPSDWSSQVELIGRFGVFHHQARLSANGVLSRTTITASSGSFSVVPAGVAADNTDPSAQDISLLGELGLRWSWQISSMLSLRSSYSLIWIDGLALAPDQIPVARPDVIFSTTELDLNGRLLMHGATLGLEARW